MDKTDTSLVFRTSSFLPEKGSVLHSDIYNREFISALASSALTGTVYMIFALKTGKTAIAYIVSAVIFIAGFLIFRRFIFIGRYLQAVFNVSAGTAEIHLSALTGWRKEVFSIRDITGLSIGSRKTGIENPDGVAFVEKVSLQHGMVIPGFGEETTFFMLKLMLADGTDRIIYADSDMQDVTSARDELKDFLGI